MKDGSQHPTNPDLYWDALKCCWTSANVPHVTVHVDDERQRAAHDLEAIADRYHDRGLPSRDAAAAKDIVDAARLLYIELYRDCGDEARRQKLKGAWLIQRYLEKVVAVDRLTTDEKHLARTFAVLDCIDVGYKAGESKEASSAFEVAAAVSKHLGWNLGGEAAFRDSFYASEEGKAARAGNQRQRTSTLPLPYRRIQKSDIDEALGF